MTRWSSRGVVLAFLAACGHHTPTTGTGKASGGGPPVLVKSVAISFQSQVDGDVSHVFMPVMDETGKVTNYPVGDVPGTCATIAADGKDLATLECKGAAVVRIHAIQQAQDVVVLRETIPPGGAPDPLNRDEVKRYAMPGDAAIKSGT